jgi:hypothetical protein
MKWKEKFLEEKNSLAYNVSGLVQTDFIHWTLIRHFTRCRDSEPILNPLNSEGSQTCP